MAIVEETIGSGKDRASATLWEANVGVFGTDTYKGIFQENAEFNEEVELAGSTGTPSITSYLWLTADPANRHAGVAGTGHARMRGSGGDHVLTMTANFTRVDWLEIQQDSSGNSDEGIRVFGDDLLIDYCIIWGDTSGSDQDGIHLGQTDTVRTRISNAIIYGFDRAGFTPQQASNGTARTQSADLDHCTFWNNNIGNDNDGGALKITSEHANDNITLGMFNCWGDAAFQLPFGDGQNNNRASPDGTVIWNGSNNGDTAGDRTDIDGTDNTTAWEDLTDGVAVVTKATGSWAVVTNITLGSEDLTLLDDAAGNLLAGNGVDRQGSEPDARQDFSVAIDGARPTTGVDIGASQVSTAGDATATPTAIAATVTVPTVTTTTSAQAEPPAVQATVTIDQPAVFIGVTVTLTAINAIVTIDTVGTTTSATTVLTAINAVVTIDSPATTTSATILATAVQATVTLDPVIASGVSNIPGAIIVQNA